jgi:hypothetical protein
MARLMLLYMRLEQRLVHRRCALQILLQVRLADSAELHTAADHARAL